MIELLVIGFLAGIVAGISPCILPVLPVVFAAGATTPTGATKPTAAAKRAGTGKRPHATKRARAAAAKRAGATEPKRKVTWWTPRARPVAVVAGLVVSFSILVLAGSTLLSLLGLSQNLLQGLGIVLLVAVGLGLLIPSLGLLLERPFARLRFGQGQSDGRTSGFVMGLGLGLLFVPCAGPVLAAITVAGATHDVGLQAVVLTLAFSCGAAVPLLVVALAGSHLQRVRAIRRRAVWVRRLSGVVLIAMALALGSSTFAGLQRAVPGYTSALQGAVEGSSQVRTLLSALQPTKGGQAAKSAKSGQATKSGQAAQPTAADLANCPTAPNKLVNCGLAPDFTDITTWLNTPGDQPLTMASLRGKVVLVDFWTYSCINCQRSLPHVEAWYNAYAADGLVVVGVHTPEFAFEHVVSNVRDQAAALGVRYPVAIDNNYGTWTAYHNEYWPADYLIDANGDVRHVGFGEGDYTQTESLIRQLLVAAHPSVALPSPTDVPNRTPKGQLSPETYVGYQNEQYLAGQVVPDQAATYRFPQALPLGEFALSGVWTDHQQEATAGQGAKLELGFLASDVYLVLGGTGTVQVSIGGSVQTLTVSGVPRLYTLFQASSVHQGTLLLTLSPGVEAYDFTFG